MHALSLKPEPQSPGFESEHLSKRHSPSVKGISSEILIVEKLSNFFWNLEMTLTTLVLTVFALNDISAFFATINTRDLF